MAPRAGVGELTSRQKRLTSPASFDGNGPFHLVLDVPITKHDEKARAFMDAEVRALLLGGAEPKLMDLMLIGALAGAPSMPSWT